MGRPPVSVVVATRDRPAMLDGCLRSLRGSLDGADELIVVDSASRAGDEVRAVVDAHAARYVRCDRPGASLARNLGWQAAVNDIVAFVDDDSRVAADWAGKLAAALADDAGVDFVTGRIDHPDPENHAERPVAIFRHKDSFEIGPTTTEPFGHGANHAVRRAVLEKVGGFDEHLGPGTPFRAAEDLDLWDRLVGAGHLGRYVTDLVGSHEQWRDRRDNVGLDWCYGLGSGARLAKLLRTDRGRFRRSARLHL
jgi:glycosyltransferase involved in cell wall biosynthesis